MLGPVHNVMWLATDPRNGFQWLRPFGKLYRPLRTRPVKIVLKYISNSRVEIQVIARKRNTLVLANE